MAKALVIYDSVTGNTEKMAKAIGDGLRESGLDVGVKRVDDTSLNDLVDADAIVMGSPTYFSTMTAKMKAFVDKSTVAKLQRGFGVPDMNPDMRHAPIKSQSHTSGLR